MSGNANTGYVDCTDGINFGRTNMRGDVSGSWAHRWSRPLLQWLRGEATLGLLCCNEGIGRYHNLDMLVQILWKHILRRANKLVSICILVYGVFGAQKRLNLANG